MPCNGAVGAASSIPNFPRQFPLWLFDPLSPFLYIKMCFRREKGVSSVCPPRKR